MKGLSTCFMQNICSSLWANEAEGKKMVIPRKPLRICVIRIQDFCTLGPSILLANLSSAKRKPLLELIQMITWWPQNCIAFKNHLGSLVKKCKFPHSTPKTPDFVVLGWSQEMCIFLIHTQDKMLMQVTHTLYFETNTVMPASTGR